ncbi:hypothetical protein ACLBW2_05785 [Enterobacteriaceae bacterium C23F]
MDWMFNVWDKIQNINLDFMIFVFSIVFIIKFKDVFDLLFRCSVFRTEQLNSAKKLLEDSGCEDSKEMTLVKAMMKNRAIKIATGLKSDKHGDLYCYLFSRSNDSDVGGLHKVIPFVEIKRDGYFFNSNELRKKRLVGIVVTLIGIGALVYLNIALKETPELNFSWLFNSLILILVMLFVNWFSRIMPDDIDVRNVKQLLGKINADNFPK